MSVASALGAQQLLMSTWRLLMGLARACLRLTGRPILTAGFCLRLSTEDPVKVLFPATRSTASSQPEEGLTGVGFAFSADGNK
jgi:hypothetical protein